MAEEHTLTPTFFENIIIKFIFTDTEIRDKLYPFLSSRLFQETKNEKIISKYMEHKETYKDFPSLAEMKMELDNEELFKHLVTIKEINISEYKDEFLLNEIQSFFKMKLINDIISETACNLVDNNIDKIADAPDLLKKALSFSFDNKIGLDFINEAKLIYDSLHNKDKIIPSGITQLDRIIEGGFHEKSLSLFMAECVSEDTKVIIRFRSKKIKDWCYKEIKISEIKKLLKNNDVEVSSPDGWVEVEKYVEKGKKVLYHIKSGKNEIFCSKNHLCETDHGWIPAKHLDNTIHKIKCLNYTFNVINGNFESGYYSFSIEKTKKNKKVVDISVKHDNHRYYTNGISSHNTNLGKSLIMCSIAANALLQNKNVLYISLEMSEAKISQRIMANIFNLQMDELKEIQEPNFYKYFTDFKKRTNNTLIIKEYPTKAVNSNHIKNLIKELQLKKNFTPDIIFLDYLGIMAACNNNKSDNTYAEIKRISEEIRGLSVELGLPIISAVQTNRGGFGNSQIDLTDIADSIGTTATADLIIGVMQSPENRINGKYTWIILKNRYGLNKQVIGVGVDYYRMRIFDDDSVSDISSTTQVNPLNEKQKHKKVIEGADIVSNAMQKDHQAKIDKHYCTDFE